MLLYDDEEEGSIASSFLSSSSLIDEQTFHPHQLNYNRESETETHPEPQNYYQLTSKKINQNSMKPTRD